MSTILLLLFGLNAFSMLHPINNIPRTVFLQFTPSLQPCTYTIQGRGYVFNQTILTVSGTGNYYIRFTRNYLGNQWVLLPPYGDLPNDPWYIRIMIRTIPWDIDWGAQNFNPASPYILAAWVPGTVQASSIIEFERKWMLPGNLPDILVFDQNYAFKYALAGSQKEGFEYPWKYNQILTIDPWQARVQVGPAITLDPTDVVHGFYPYAERDVIYTHLDVNPFTNPDVRNRVVQFFHIPAPASPALPMTRTFFYRILNLDGTVYKVYGPGSLLNTITNPAGSSALGTVISGPAPATAAFTITDIRARGGGLAPQFQQIPQANHFWDLGYLDGRPYPLGQHWSGGHAQEFSATSDAAIFRDVEGSAI